MEATLLLALTTQRCELYLMPSRRVETAAMATLRPRHGMWMMGPPSLGAGGSPSPMPLLVL